jgi:ABC-type lipoprotein release transport system permease subunit
MMLKIAWRNIWRNRVRSLVVIGSIMVGMVAASFLMAFYTSIIEQRIDNVINSEVSHIQFHHPEFREDYESKFFFESESEILDSLASIAKVKSYASRAITTGMIASSNGSIGGQIIGVDPEDEQILIGLDQHLKDGEYLSNEGRNPLYISESMAEDLNLKVRSKVVITFQDISGEIVSGSFRVCGIYRSGNAMFDERYLFVRKNDLQGLLGASVVHEIAVLLNSHEDVDAMTERLSHNFSSYEVLNWVDISPGMNYMISAMDETLRIIVWIILLALGFGIINTMLMAVLERYKEIGMLMAIGMTRLKVFTMVVLETIYLTMIGGPLGLLIGFLIIEYFGKNGIDLSVMSEAMESLGYDTVIYTKLSSAYYMEVLVNIMVLAILASIYPARKAIKLNPVEAIRKI